MIGYLLKITYAAIAEGKQQFQLFNSFLREYRATRHPSSGKIPSELLMGHSVRTGLPHPQESSQKDYENVEIRKGEEEQKKKHKEYANKIRRACHVQVKPGDVVVVKQEKNKSTTSLGA